MSTFRGRSDGCVPWTIADRVVHLYSRGRGDTGEIGVAYVDR